MYSKLDFSRIDETREQVRAALADTADDKIRSALADSLHILDSLVEAPQADSSSRHAGSVDYTFEDEAYEPYGRQVDVRIYYDWDDYDRADEPSPVWGPTIADIEVLAVRYFDEHGHEALLDEHHTDVAWDLLNKQMEQVIEACTEHGCQHGAGRAPVTYASLRIASKPAAPAQPGFAARMAPSVPTRTARQDRRQHG